MADGFPKDLPKARVRRAESALDRSTRLAWDILDEEAQKRDAKTAQLRQSRLDRESQGPADDHEGAKTADTPPMRTDPPE